ncbi:ribbon-helix-helix domain-containing protein [Polaribacter sp. M15]
MNGKISIRISDSLKDKLSEMSEIEGVSISEVSRTILEQYFTNLENNIVLEANNNQPEQEGYHLDETSYIDEFDYEEPDIVYTVEFLQLVTWMFDQKESRLLEFDKTILEQFKNTIIKVHSSTRMKQELKNEFNKVFVDLIKELNSSYPSFYRLNFAYQSSDAFDFELLNQFIFDENLGTISITL